jgi:hypothetical protein
VTLAELLANATPGPWGNFMGPSVLRAYDHQTRLAIFDAHEGTDYEQPAEANARLSALAPDLARLALDMGGALDTLAGMAHPVTGEDHDWLYDHLPALLARLDGIANKDKTT